MKVISIGCNCDVATFIKNNFNSESYPFDWLWTTIDFIINTFETDYFKFSECEKLIAEFAGHTYIHSGGLKRTSSAISLHDADGQSESEYISNIPLINEKYKRRFKRLYDTLNQDEDIILIRKVLPLSQGAIKHSVETDEKINYLSELLSKKFKAKITICILDNQVINKNNTLNNIKFFNSEDELLIFIKSQI